MAAARMPATEIEAYEDDTRLHFNGESDFPRVLTQLFKELTRFPKWKWMRKLWSSILSLSIKRCVCFIYPGIPRDSSSNINARFQGDLTIIPFYPWPGLGREYKDWYPVEWTGLEGQQHPTHSTLLNAFYLKKLVRQQRCYLLLKERGPLGHTHTIILLWWETAALAKHCCRADRHRWTLVRDYLRFLCHRR